MDIGRGQEPYGAVVMFVRVPLEEFLGPTAGIGLTSEPIWIIQPVLQGLELRFRVRVIVGNVRARAGFGHA